jgi:vacuolar-type H+-ATPase subunit F/Vma7
MTHIVTFLGKAQYLKEAIEKNRITDVFIDRSYTIGEVYYKRGVNYHYMDTGIKPSENCETEVINRRIRIAKMIREIISKIDDNIFFIDSDVIIDDIENLLKHFENVNVPTVIAIPAKAKPTSFMITFFLSTNFYLPLSWKPRLREVLDNYLNNSLYTTNPVDIYIHTQLQSQTLYVKGVCHYIDGTKVCIQ